MGGMRAAAFTVAPADKIVLSVLYISSSLIIQLLLDSKLFKIYSMHKNKDLASSSLCFQVQEVSSVSGGGACSRPAPCMFLSLQSWISKVFCSSVEKGFVGEGVVRWRPRPSRAAHWASKASSCGAAVSWEEGAAQLPAPLKGTLLLDGCREAGFVGGWGLMKGLRVWESCWGAEEDGGGNGRG